MYAGHAEQHILEMALYTWLVFLGVQDGSGIIDACLLVKASGRKKQRPTPLAGSHDAYSNCCRHLQLVREFGASQVAVSASTAAVTAAVFSLAALQVALLCPGDMPTCWEDPSVATRGLKKGM